MIKDEYGVCPICKKPFKLGETLRFKIIDGKKILYHPWCGWNK
jgi:hypothetical protein